MEKLALLLVISWTGFRLSHCSLVTDGHYRIRSISDGLYASAGAESADLSLGEVTTEKWGNFREQRWDLKKTDIYDNIYWLFSQDNSFNRLTARVFDGRRMQHDSELVPVTFGTYLIRSTTLDLCLYNPGYGLKTQFVTCDLNERSQQWEFDLLTSQ